MIQIDSVTKHFGSVIAVDQLSFELHSGEVLGLLGPNGSGKTTTVKMLLGILRPDSGTMRVDGLEPAIDGRAVKARIGYVAEESLLFNSMTPRDTFELVIAVRGLHDAHVQIWFDRLVSSFDLAESLDAPIATLSRGNRQKVEIIAALLHRPKVLILDEPLSGLDATAVRVFKELLAMHAERGGGVILSTHILEIAEDMCDRICLISSGRAVATGSMEELQVASGRGESSLEELFLELTNQDERIAQIIQSLRAEDA
jgi:ABC-2 type transport system ATP-binding protein